MGRFTAVLTLLFLLGACSSTPGLRTARAGGSGGGEQGYYKVGKPYQINGVTYTPAFDPDYDETGIASWYAGEFTGEPTANGELYDPNQLTAAHRTLPMPSLVRVTNLDNGRALIVRINDRGPYAQNRIIDLSRRCAQLLGFQQKGTAKVRVQILAKDSEALADAARHGELATMVASAIETNPTGAAAPVQTASTEPVQLVAETPPPPAPAPPRDVQATPLADSTGGIGVVDEKAVIVEETGAPAPKGQDVGGRFLPAPVVAHETIGKTRIFIQAGAFAAQENAARLRDRLAAEGAQVVPAVVNGRTLYRVRIGPLQDVPSADRELNQVVGNGASEAKIIVE